jgi:pimeloyl-ACP methyl ester carboxylesterase
MVTRVAFKPYQFNPALPHLLSRVAVPTLVMYGEEDHLVPRSCAQRYATVMPQSSLVTFPGGGHWLDLEQPRQLAQCVIDFGKAHAARLTGVTEL